ncbi:sigma-70 family RNA polymerase sigma factor, partial [Nitriliruptoraceae bacterium ZYF776]|nr:sigma-70 family RNA polymerase sigma factor [Profundirhabdus halotolerans]
ERHVGHESAQDVVAETFHIAWRKWDRLPEVKFPWLVTTARKVIGNHVRSRVRRRNLVDKLALLEDLTANSDVEQGDRLAAVARLAALNEMEREALLLVAWDGLSTDSAAEVLGITPAAFRK